MNLFFEATATPDVRTINRTVTMARMRNLTMRLCAAGLHQCQTKALYFNHRFPPWSTEGAARDRSNRLLGD